MKIAVSGASGFVGRMLVPILAAAGADLLLLGRNPQHLAQLFPKRPSCSYNDFESIGQGCTALLHLAVINTNATATPAQVHAVNVDLTLALAKTAQDLGIVRFINISSIQALDPRNISPYASSKRAAAAQLAAMSGIRATTLYLPLVYSAHWAGKLRWLNHLPQPIAKVLFHPIAALKPTLHIHHLAEVLMQPLDGPDEIILADDQDENLIFRAGKRLIDLAFVAAVAILLGWALVLIWALVKLQSPGPGLFAQTRIGRGGRPFTCYKFRSMKTGTLQVGTHDAPADAVTRLGHSLRCSKLDELPQIWNILRNEMSLIGPRPCLPMQTALIAERHARGVLTLKPGISGLSQVNGIDMRDPVVLAQSDARYKALRGLVLDLKIIVATIRRRDQF